MYHSPWIYLRQVSRCCCWLSPLQVNHRVLLTHVPKNILFVLSFFPPAFILVFLQSILLLGWCFGEKNVTPLPVSPTNISLIISELFSNIYKTHQDQNKPTTNPILIDPLSHLFLFNSYSSFKSELKYHIFQDASLWIRNPTCRFSSIITLPVTCWNHLELDHKPTVSISSHLHSDIMLVAKGTRNLTADAKRNLTWTALTWLKLSIKTQLPQFHPHLFTPLPPSPVREALTLGTGTFQKNNCVNKPHQNFPSFKALNIFLLLSWYINLYLWLFRELPIVECSHICVNKPCIFSC